MEKQHSRLDWIQGRSLWFTFSGDQPPPICADCGYLADHLCDAPIGQGCTCDRNLCSCCRIPIGKNMDYCKHHYAKFSEHPNGEPTHIIREKDLRPTIVNINRGDKFTVYIGRAGDFKQYRSDTGHFGNPIQVNKQCPFCKKVHTSRSSTLPCFREYHWRRMNEDALFRFDLRSLAGARLGCFCAPSPCHGEIIADSVVWLWSADGLKRFPLPQEDPRQKDFIQRRGKT